MAQVEGVQQTFSQGQERVKTELIRPMTLHDVQEVVKVHLQAFQGFFLSFLGVKFLRELYIGILFDPSGIAYVYERAGKTAGFVAGTDEPSRFYQRLLRQRWWCFGRAALLPALRKPTIIPRLVRALSMHQNKRTLQNTGMLMSIAVSPSLQGKSIGHQLVASFLKESSRRKLSQVKLTTDRFNNDKANRFYQSLGFRLIRSYKAPEGREMNEYSFELTSPR